MDAESQRAAPGVQKGTLDHIWKEHRVRRLAGERSSDSLLLWLLTCSIVYIKYGSDREPFVADY